VLSRPALDVEWHEVWAFVCGPAHGGEGIRPIRHEYFNLSLFNSNFPYVVWAQPVTKTNGIGCFRAALTSDAQTLIPAWGGQGGI